VLLDSRLRGNDAEASSAPLPRCPAAQLPRFPAGRHLIRLATRAGG